MKATFRIKFQKRQRTVTIKEHITLPYNKYMYTVTTEEASKT